MRITIVMGFFLPMPPAAGGATEKTWHRLAGLLADAGHQVTVFSRQWSSWPNEEIIDRVRHVRLRGYDHRRRLAQNLFLDFLWSRRVSGRLPPADVVVVHAVTLPVWLGWLHPRAGRVVVMPGRMPRGQYRHYRRIARVLATSRPVSEQVTREKPALASVTRVVGYPIDWTALARPRPAAGSPLTIGYVGRIHPEKGIDLLIDAVLRLSRDSTLPSWRLSLCGPVDVAAGGGGEGYRNRLCTRLRDLPPSQWNLHPPIFQEESLAELYRSLDVFCYPSLSAGETFGVAVAEAMAAGATPVVSNLACFRDFVRPGCNGLTFDHASPDAAGALATALGELLRDPAHRRSLANAAQADVAEYDYPRYAAALAHDFNALVTPGN